MYVFPAPAQPSVAIRGSALRFPVHRIHCVGRNYAEHAKEMGSVAGLENPTFFSKPADAVVADGVDVPYPPGTTNLHFEVELVLALSGGGSGIAPERALDHVYGYAVGLDLTRRDLQAAAKARGGPWDTAKGFDHSAPISAIAPASEVGHPAHGLLWLEVNGQRRQQADIGEMIYGVRECIAELSKWYALAPGDLIYTGTPAGVGPLQRGDRFVAGFADIARLEGRIA